MKKKLENDELIRLEQKVNTILDNLSLQSVKPIREALADQTKDSFSEIVTNNKGQKYFLKVRLLETPAEKQKFKKIDLIHKYIQSSDNAIKDFTAEMIDSNTDGKNDYILFEYLEGQSMGSRTEHDAIKLETDDIDTIHAVNENLKNLDHPQLAQIVPEADFSHYKYLLFEDAGFDTAKLSELFDKEELAKIVNLGKDTNLQNLINSGKKVFAHGDFQPPNFFQTDDRLMLVDFDSALLSHPLYDIAYLYNHAYRKPEFQQALLDKFEVNKLSGQNKYLFTFVLFCLTFVWIKVFLNKKDWYIDNQVPDYLIREKIFKLRCQDGQKFLREI